MSKAYIQYNRYRSDAVGITGVVVKLLGTIQIPTPQKRYDTITIPGRDGLLYEEDAYDDIVIPLEMEIQDLDLKENEDAIDIVKRWLKEATDPRLFLSVDERSFYRVHQVEMSEIEIQYRRYGQFTAKFTCDPYRYQAASDVAVNLTEQLMNNYAVSRPIYIITGNGACTLTVNGNAIPLTVDGELTINTEKQLCYKSQGVFANKAMTGEFSDLFLLQGKNTLALTDGFTGKIITNMRKI